MDLLAGMITFIQDILQADSTCVKTTPQYVRNIFEGIEALSKQRFKDSKLKVVLNDPTCFLLTELQNSKCFFGERHRFSKIIDPKLAVKGLLGTGIIGLGLEKTAFNSLNDEVSPQFIQCLKASTIAYCTLLSCGWAKTKACWMKDLLNITSTIFVIKNIFKDMGPEHCVLRQISQANGFQNKIQVLGTTEETYIGGEKADVMCFIQLLKAESFQDGTYKMLQLAKIDPDCTLFLPREIIDLIINAYFHCTYTEEAYRFKEIQKDLKIDKDLLVITKSFRPQ